jgi:hypothetical protein
LPQSIARSTALRSTHSLTWDGVLNFLGCEVIALPALAVRRELRRHCPVYSVWPTAPDASISSGFAGSRTHDCPEKSPKRDSSSIPSVSTAMPRGRSNYPQKPTSGLSAKPSRRAMNDGSALQRECLFGLRVAVPFHFAASATLSDGNFETRCEFPNQSNPNCWTSLSYCRPLKE